MHRLIIQLPNTCITSIVNSARRDGICVYGTERPCLNGTLVGIPWRGPPELVSAMNIEGLDVIAFLRSGVLYVSRSIDYVYD